MFWRGRRKHKEAAAADAALPEAAKATLRQHGEEDVPEPETSGEETEDAVATGNENEEETKEETIISNEDSNEKNAGEDDNLSPTERLERKRQEALQAQKVQEIKALARNSFCKNQRVKYLHKASGRQYEAVVSDVHFDDGIDRPYFTIRYNNAQEMIEKQTTSDRLSYVGFDEAKTYQIISSKIKL